MSDSLRTLLVAGSRSLETMDPAQLEHMLSNASYIFDCTIDRVIHGAARGIDTMAAQWATKRGKIVDAFPAEWERLGRSAGYQRNHTIVKECDMGIVVWDRSSQGSLHTYNLLLASGKPTVLVLP